MIHTVITRSQLVQNSWENCIYFCPNWTFMVYGADADLIMLGLSTHLKYFNLIREKMPPYNKQVSFNFIIENIGSNLTNIC